jgi:hypothetical protein
LVCIGPYGRSELGRLRGASARSGGDLDRPLSAENIHQDKLALVRAHAGVEAVEAGEQPVCEIASPPEADNRDRLACSA